MRPLAVDLFTGPHGWSEGLVAEGWRVIGFDIEDMCGQFGEPRPQHVELVLQDVRTLHGAQFKDAALILASPPCQQFSYMAMPWKRGKQIARALRGEDEFPEGYRGSRTIAELTALFDACFRIQREACEAAGRHIPLVVENVKGAQPWVGRAKWSFGSYFLWGDVPALMPIQKYHMRLKCPPGEQWNVNRENFTGTRGWDEGLKNGELGGGSWFAIGSPGQKVTGINPDGRKNPGFRFDGSGKGFQSESVDRHVAPEEGFKSKGMNWSNRELRGQDFTRIAGAQAEGRKGGSWFEENNGPLRQGHSKSPARKAASAKIAKIPFALSSWIARTYKPPETIGRAILEAMEEA